ncbi:hypothetical protein SAMN05878482_105127 [Peribacillus simplex]|uniref:Uncharacterized protein n=1 Tax=Peribacillus simplex TaxID=1478 RepID=A0A9X8RB27_9BACI|nr:hypothetical protein [Peribacillus simplex]SIR70814.1 hypothetical protein SAMN05878482_105127 [Peribacillus simplex]
MSSSNKLSTVKGNQSINREKVQRCLHSGNWAWVKKALFRRFGSKKNLLEPAFDRYHYAKEMTKFFNEEQIVWNLHSDLQLISRTYHEIMNRNPKMIMISIKEEGNLPRLRERTHKHSRQLLEISTKYFNAMHEGGKLIHTDPELQAFSFMKTNFGAFMNNLDDDEN